LESRLQGGDGSDSSSYFSTHPATGERVSSTRAQAGQYAQGGTINHDRHLEMINGMVYGDSEKQGFVRGNSFFHPDIGFTFSVPNGFQIQNQPEQVVAVSKTGAAIIFDLVGSTSDPMSYLTREWVKGEAVDAPESITVNGMPGATAGFTGNLNGAPVNIRLIAIKWGNKMARFQMAIPQSASAAQVNGMKSSAYSFRPVTEAERQNLKPYRIHIVTAGAGDTVASLAGRMAYSDMREDRFRVLNGLASGAQVKVGQKYKIISDK
jgi:predicted Zn-dependent protease